MPYFEALLDMEIQEDGRFAELAAAWISHAGRLAPESWDLLRRQESPLSDAYYSDQSAVLGPPDGRWASYRVVARPYSGRIRARPYSPEAHDEVLRALAGRPLEVKFQILELGAKGIPVSDGAHGLFLHVTADEDEPERVQFRAVSTIRGDECDIRRPDAAARWCDVLLEAASAADPSFGHLADDGKHGRRRLTARCGGAA
ncbi:hypothetical protein HUT06_16220 [Actinomadura sp. NAK00032]|uniref:hypothetical protein n=1 Tax=Actinomadura sp. NAK00032 TaxID=2742128 RepID=UPI001592801F|nr:hypothetical protein [Actinomadura sp. NAK00032]QKW35390.1 hypothetical protein HUT06_16220 [Actinomadura sp. NAK00032]